MARTTYGNPGGSAGLRVTNLRDTIKQMESAGVAVADLKDGWNIVGDDVRERAQRIAPKGRTGNLKNSIKRSRMKSGVRVWAGGRNAPYAFWWYTGTRRNPQVQFLHKAVQEADLGGLVGEALEYALAKAGVRL